MNDKRGKRKDQQIVEVYFSTPYPHRSPFYLRATLFLSLPLSSSTSIGSDAANIPPKPVLLVLLVRLRPLDTEVCGIGGPWNSAGDESNIIMTACLRLAPVAITSLLLSRLVLLTVRCEFVSMKGTDGRGCRAVGGESLRDLL